MQRIENEVTVGCAGENPAQPFLNMASWLSCLITEPQLKAHYAVELGVAVKKLHHAHEVFFALGEMMTIWRAAGLLATHPEYEGAYERAQLAYQAARGYPHPTMEPTDAAE